ncbi:hypothetical protein V6N12_051685 [Hibiscus sabdariffa]|uniref:Uncharacterized protein n=1 Tax=Hibiscus sabdariffa TaxID=183260 RepID=A0ABR2GHA8_9ROSI
MIFTRARATRKQYKSDVRRSIGNERDFMVDPFSQQPRDNSDPAPVMIGFVDNPEVELKEGTAPPSLVYQVSGTTILLFFLAHSPKPLSLYLAVFLNSN